MFFYDVVVVVVLKVSTKRFLITTATNTKKGHRKVTMNIKSVSTFKS